MKQIIINWAEKENVIKTIILIGSRANKDITDELSDYDFSVFCETYEPYIKSDEWLSSLGDVWVCVHETRVCSGKIFPTRLIIFEGGIKVDLSFFTLDILQDLISKPYLPEEYNVGYSILLDKEGFAKNFPKPFASIIKKPTRLEFQNVIQEFWFEAYHVAKYLKREDLWSVKFRLGLINDNFLLKMIEWNEQGKRNWKSSFHPTGKNMHLWVSEMTWKEIKGIFASFSISSNWEALLNTISLFRRLAIETGEILNFPYLQELDNNLSDFILKLHK